MGSAGDPEYNPDRSPENRQIRGLGYAHGDIRTAGCDSRQLGQLGRHSLGGILPEVAV